MDKTLITDLQDMILSNLLEGDKSAITNDANIFSLLGEHDHNFVLDVMGDIGSKLYNLVGKIDTCHPLFVETANGTLFKGGSLYQNTSEILDIAKHAQENNWESALSILKHTLNKEYKDIDIFKKLSLASAPPRILCTKELRKQRRLKKQVKFHDVLVGNLEKEDQFFEHYENFNIYIRNGNLYKDEIYKLEQRIEDAKSIYLQAQVIKLEHEIRSIKRILEDSYNRFIRIRMKDAAIISSRLIGAQYDSVSNKILVHKKTFNKDDFWNTNKKSIILNDVFNINDEAEELDYPYLTFSARAYPLDKFKAKVPERLSKIIDIVDNYPSIGNRPLFDYYWVIVPSVDLPLRQFKKDKEIIENSDIASFYEDLDAYLTDKNYIHPILLGENSYPGCDIQTKCYFIGFWQ